MAKRIVPSTFECNCGHQIHFFESTVSGMEAESRKARKPQRIRDSEDGKHDVVFEKGRAVSVMCPQLGRCEITGWA